MDTHINYSEAMDEAERLKRVTGQPHVVVREDCRCDYSKTCLRCAGEGGYYEIVRQTVVRTEHARLQSCVQVEIERVEQEAT